MRLVFLLLCAHGAIEQWMIKGGKRWTAFSYGVEYDDLVISVLEPWSRNEERLLRANIPIASDRMTVYPHRPLA